MNFDANPIKVKKKKKKGKNVREGGREDKKYFVLFVLFLRNSIFARRSAGCGRVQSVCFSKKRSIITFSTYLDEPVHKV